MLCNHQIEQSICWARMDFTIHTKLFKEQIFIFVSSAPGDVVEPRPNMEAGFSCVPLCSPSR